jgi:hypothetical protein
MNKANAKTSIVGLGIPPFIRGEDGPEGRARGEYDVVLNRRGQWCGGGSAGILSAHAGDIGGRASRPTCCPGSAGVPPAIGGRASRPTTLSWERGRPARKTLVGPASVPGAVNLARGAGASCPASQAFLSLSRKKNLPIGLGADPFLSF